MADRDGMPTCFIAMPITTHPVEIERYQGDQDHWKHVMDSLFVKAIDAAGFQAVKPIAQGAHLIHGLIIEHLSTADLVLVDLSGHNPNVFFELGVRTSLNLPIALVRDEHTSVPFDTAGINAYTYDSHLRGWDIVEQQQSLAQHIRDSAASCAGQNPLWRQFGLTIRASEPDASESPLEAKVDLLTHRLLQMQSKLEEERALRERLVPAEDVPLETTWPPSDAAKPVERFVRGVIRVMGDELRVEVEPIGDNSALVRVPASLRPHDLDRIHDLAKKHEVAIKIHDLGPRGESSAAHATTEPNPTEARDSEA